jgi:hypothetical protein
MRERKIVTICIMKKVPCGGKHSYDPDVVIFDLFVDGFDGLVVLEILC